ncbi:unnamed protein product [Parascedosporium putredinis]|uniref:Uncharacterized protein n=1 Tax=Parascedosporium putredinis TaxID=1442378 RepID=A0A9P1H134_9PEZI|nr:unnamed protein product [Parascedosporium putredinis]CAI7992364.1 unnamed protein product [Parascedosporium putredinis]
MVVMDRLTDKPDWQRKIFDDSIVEKWKREAINLPLQPFWEELAEQAPDNWRADFAAPRPERMFTEEMFDYCVMELRDKARYAESSGVGVVRTLEGYARAAKSDTVVGAELRKDLIDAFDTLTEHQADTPDWHPGSDEMVRNLVHPSMYPLVWGRSHIIREPVVGVEDAVDPKWLGKGQPYEADMTRRKGNGLYEYKGHDGCWSKTYQWLPSNVAFRDDGGVRFTSYINNLHPTRYPEIYRTLEKLVECALPIWDQCLFRYWTHGVCRTADPEFNQFDDYDKESENFADDRLFQLFRKAKHPQPLPYKPRDYNIEEKDTLRGQFRDSGLQIIVKMASIELTPEKPTYPGGNWHLEGQLNEHIVGTALYYLDADNVTPSRLSFRKATDGDSPDLRDAVGQDSFSWAEEVYAMFLRDGFPVQSHGSVVTAPGRLLAFPNVLQHRVEPFGLEDETRPGRRRFVALWLVDPHFEIVSTANVAPQQGAIMAERSISHEKMERELMQQGYCFCEH